MKRIRRLFIFNQIFFLVFAFFLNFFLTPDIFAASDGVDVDLYVLGCNNNGVCESVLTEDFLTCSNDCYCDNDNICEPQTGEDFLTCTNDCRCNNDNVCDTQNGETIGNCPNDCTPVVPPDPEEATSTITGGGYRQLLIYNIETRVDLDNQKVYISWKTNNSALSVLYWGRDQDYKIETLSSIRFAQEHSTSIENVPFGEYYFIIKARDFYGDSVFSGIESFKLSKDDVDFPPSNPTNFRTFPTEEGIGLAWTNPTDSDFSRVKLVRETRGFPSTYLDGKVVYEGGGQSVIDYYVEEGETYYYSLFALDEAGNSSTGVVMQVKYTYGVLDDDIYNQSDDNLFDDNFDTQVDDQITDPLYFPIERYSFSQDDQEIQINNGILAIDGSKQLKISVDSKYIDPKNEVVAYFDINQNRNYSGYKFKNIPENGVYEALVPAFGVDDEIPFVIVIYSRTGEELRRTRGILASFLPKTNILDSRENYDEVVPSFTLWIILAILLFLGLILFKKRP